MRIALMMPLLSPWARDAALQLARAGVDLHLIDFSDPALEGSYLATADEFWKADLEHLSAHVSGIHQIRSSVPPPARYFTAVRRVRSLLRRIRPDVLLTLYAGGYATMSMLSGYRPYAVYVVGSDVLLSGGVRRYLTRAALRAADLVLANGEYLAEQTRVLMRAGNVMPLYLGVRADELMPGEPSQRPTIICTRGFAPIYNNGYLVEGLAAWGDEVPPDLRVVFTASGPEIDDVRESAERTLTPALRSGVEFLGGIARRELVRELRSATVYVSLSRSDGTSISLLEALSCGVFPVLSDLPQNREWVSAAEGNGELVALERPELLAAALARSFGDPERRQRASEQNRRMVIERANSPTTLQTLLNALDGVVDRRRSRQSVAADLSNA